MAATTKEQLLALSAKEFSKLEQILARVGTDAAVVKDEDETSIKDVVGHRAHWIDLFLGWYRDGVAGRDVHIPAKGYKWNQLKQYNAELRIRQAHLGWPETCEMLCEAHRNLMEFIGNTSEADLYGGPMTGANNAGTAGRFAEAAGSSHYRSAAKYIRARLRDGSGASPVEL